MLEFARSEKQNLFEGKHDVQFTMVSSFSIFSITLNKVSVIQILNLFCSPLNCDSSICLLGRAIEVMLKLCGSCHLPVALKHPQSLCLSLSTSPAAMRELVHVQGGQMSDIGLYACKIEVLSLFLVHDFQFYALVCLLSLTYDIPEVSSSQL